MIATRFDAELDAIVVETTVWNHRGEARPVRMVLDTGAGMTIVVPEVSDALGYGPRASERPTVIRSAVGEERGYLRKVARFAALGFEMTDFPVHVHSLPDGHGIEGLLEFDFLRTFNYCVLSALGELRVAPIASTPSRPRKIAQWPELHGTRSSPRIPPYRGRCAGDGTAVDRADHLQYGR